MPLNKESKEMEKVEVNCLSHFCWTIGQDENQEKLERGSRLRAPTRGRELTRITGLAAPESPDCPFPYSPKVLLTKLFPGSTTEKPIPMGFMKNLKKGRRGLPGEAILTCSSGQSWKVKLCLDADGLFLSKGWGKFFKENQLCERDFLLFRYDGGKTIKFDVRVFGANGLPKVKASDSGKENVCKQVENNTSRRVKDECLSLDVQPEISAHKKKRDELVETGVTTMALVRYPINEVPSPWSKSLAFSSNSPFFRCILDERSVKRYLLKIPKAACPIDMFPSEKTDIILRNSNLQFWVVNVQPTMEAYTFQASGWRKFVQENDLREGYVCVFELLEINELLVHVFH
ncbi:unnamed protein product [Cuscuta campestris]|uniref:TF-B3 domain-containing protein n=1 Tax=Cuscuta campestris TaxID=132261 RepID=A0A484L023_9ASTE|nr:unnamed protein product [Cuscuta campestris]